MLSEIPKGLKSLNLNAARQSLKGFSDVLRTH